MSHAESARIMVNHPARCVVCGGNQWSFVREGADLYRPDCASTFKLMRCLACGHIAQNPYPGEDQLRLAYSAEYAPYRAAWKERGWPVWKILREITTRRRMSRLKKYAKGNKLLEVGAGAGDFLHAARQAGWDVKAIEYSSGLAQALKDELELDVRAGELAPGLWEEKDFDLVVFWSVLEHVRDPLHSLITAAAYLKPGGAIFMQLPTQHGVELGAWFKGNWALLDLPRHLNFFGKDSLARLCDKAGFDLIVFKTPLTDTAWCYAASALNNTRNSGMPLKRYLGFAAFMTILVLSLPWLAVQAWMGRGTEAFAVATKR